MRYQPIQLIREGFPVRVAEGRRPAGLHAAGPHGLHEIAHVEPLADVFGGIALAAWGQHTDALVDQVRGQGDVGRDGQVAVPCLCLDVLVCFVEAARDLDGADVAGAWGGQRLVRDEDDLYGLAVRDAVEHLLDHPGAGICIHPDTGPGCGRFRAQGDGLSSP